MKNLPKFDEFLADNYWSKITIIGGSRKVNGFYSNFELLWC